MSVSVTMPRLGESVSEGTVTRWLKKEGDRVEADEPLLEVSTDKVDTEIPAPASGVLTSIRVSEDETVEVGVELAVIDGAGAEAAAPPVEQPTPPPAPAPAPPPPPAPAAPATPPPPPPAAPTPPPAAPAAPVSVPAQPAAPTPVVTPTPTATPTPSAPRADEEAGTYVTPLVRKLAAEHNVDLSTVQGTGVGGRIRKQDVLETARQQAAAARTAAAEQVVSEAAPAAPRPQTPVPSAAAAVRGRTEKMTRLRSVIAARMTESLQVSAQLTTVVEIDVTRIARLRERVKADFEAREGVRLSFLPFFALATVEALKQHPKVNASIDTEAGTVTYHDAEHLGMAVDTERGLLVPVIHDAGDLNLAGMARKISDLADRSRENKVSPDELVGGTFTLTNTGSRGALFDTPIINQPQVGILGTGTVVKRPVVVDDPGLGEYTAIRSMVYFALTYDHRLVDGADAARFLATVKEYLENSSFDSAV